MSMKLRIAHSQSRCFSSDGMCFTILVMQYTMRHTKVPFTKVARSSDRN